MNIDVAFRDQIEGSRRATSWHYLLSRIIHFTVGFVFYAFSLCSGLLFLSLAQKWKNLALIWHRCEKIFLNLPYKECGWKLSTKIRITAAVIIFLAIVEHLLSVLNNGYNFHTKLVNCHANITDKWKYYFLNEHPHIFSILPYHFLLTILIEVRR